VRIRWGCLQDVYVSKRKGSDRWMRDAAGCNRRGSLHTKHSVIAVEDLLFFLFALILYSFVAVGDGFRSRKK